MIGADRDAVSAVRDEKVFDLLKASTDAEEDDLCCSISSSEIGAVLFCLLKYRK
jgi:hypothetical protein